VLRALDASARAGGVASTTLGGYLERFPELPVAEPAPSSWGEGGFGQVWAGPEAARLWRHVHHAERAVCDAASRARRAEGLAGRALDQAIRELLLLEASDWAFMICRGEMSTYAEARVRAHAHRATRLATIALADGATPEDVTFVEEVSSRDCFLAALQGEGIRDAFDPW
jgi:1,4-alpha-glucan branching enzyme